MHHRSCVNWLGDMALITWSRPPHPVTLLVLALSLDTAQATTFQFTSLTSEMTTPYVNHSGVTPTDGPWMMNSSSSSSSASSAQATMLTIERTELDEEYFDTRLPPRRSPVEDRMVKIGLVSRWEADEAPYSAVSLAIDRAREEGLLRDFNFR